MKEAGEKKLPVIGVFPITNTAGICVHEIDHVDDRVLASINGKDPQWYLMKEDAIEENGEREPGFLFGSFFVPFSEVLKV